MLVSIIIPVHITLDFFRSCVESALAQTHQNIEIILACNGALGIQECRKYLDIQDARLVFIQTGQGRHNARNEALAIAKGAWIQFLDYDDYLYPQKVATQLSSLAKSNPAGLSICKWKKFNIAIEEYYRFVFEGLFDETEIRAADLIRKIGDLGGFVATSSWLVSKDLTDGLKWIDSPNDDAVFLSAMLKKNPKIIMISEVLSGYRIHELNTSSNRSKEELDKLMLSWKIIHSNLFHLKEAQTNLYLYKAYLNLIRYSKQIGHYSLGKIVWNSLYFGCKAGVGFVVFKDVKNKLMK